MLFNLPFSDKTIDCEKYAENNFRKFTDTALNQPNFKFVLISDVSTGKN